MQVYSVVLALEAVAGSKLFVTGDEAGEIKVIYFVVCKGCVLVYKIIPTSAHPTL